MIHPQREGSMAKASNVSGTKNHQRPFCPGDIILLQGQMYEVVENWGRDGKVRVYPPSPRHPDAFYFRWYEDEEHSLLLLPAEYRPDLDQ
ncbi:MAG TPA: hypothetical protein VHG08_07330 [Longimicrobium sp.]|nr:hypothetical protein [Longimicrobium sp.]